MGRHGHHFRRYRNTYEERDHRDPLMGGSAGYDALARLPRKLPAAVVLVGLLLWSLLAWIGFSLVDPVLGWLAVNIGLLVDSGEGLATSAGAGNVVGSILGDLNLSGFLGQVIALLQVLLKPAIVIVWAIGAFILVASPLILPKIGRLLAGRRH